MRIRSLAPIIVAVAALALAPVAMAKGLGEGPPSGVKPPGEGPIPKGKSDVIDDVLEYSGWKECVFWGGSFWCSPQRKR